MFTRRFLQLAAFRLRRHQENIHRLGVYRHCKTALLLGVFGTGMVVSNAQSTSGSISGTIVDPAGRSLDHADITLTDQLTGETISVHSDKNGFFVFPVLKPGTYNLKATETGFNALEKNNLVLQAAAKLSAGTLLLNVGSVRDVITVSAAATPVQTTSSERGYTITSDQIAGLMSEGRDFESLTRIVPGSTYSGPGNQQLNQTPNGGFNGVSAGNVSTNTDGVISNTRNLGYDENPLNLDAIQEIKVLDANYQAEYGKVAGAIIDVVSKSGTRDFHGTAAYYFRNEALNANSFFNNYDDVARPYYRYNTVTGSIGGPIYGPGRFASLRDKLFFFYAQDYEPDKTPGVLAQFTMPTALERSGDFSQSIRSDGSHYDIYDPTTCSTASGTQVCQQFPNDVIPSGRINPTLQKLLNIFPLPNFTNRAVSQGNYNYVVQTQITSPARQENLRMDYSPTQKLKMYFRFTDLNNRATGKNEPAIHANWQNGTGYYNTNAKTYAANVTYIINSHMVNELVAGVNFWYETAGADSTALQQFSKSAQGIDIPQLYPANNPDDFLPAVSLGTIPNSPGYSYDGRFPMSNVTIAPSVSDGLSVVYGSHNMKFGIYGDNAAYEQRHQSGSGQFSGQFTFTGANSSNPNNAGYPYSEALLGDFDTYQEPTSRPTSYGVLSTLEWYGQDSWRATKRLTMEYGIRFTYDIPESLKNRQGALIDFSQYNAGSAAQLYMPISTTQVEDPTTGQIFPIAYQDHFVPGTGSSSPGAVLANSPNFPGFFKSEGVLLVPRLGFAYDVFGNGKTALRGGFGMFTNPLIDQDDFENVTFNPPEIFYPTQYYGNVDTLTSSQGLLGPSSFTAYQHNPHRPQNMNMTLGLQQEVGFGTVLDVAYVGVLGRHLLYNTNINEVPYGAEFAPAHQYPGTSSPLPDDYYRPFPGYSTIGYGSWGDNSVYHSLQAQLKRDFSHGLHFGVAYTWSKLIDDNKGATYLPYTLFRGVTSSNQPQRLVVNYLWSIPNASQVWNNFVTRRVLDGWQVSGITTFSSGGPTTISFSTTDGQNITGGGDGAYVTQVGEAEIGRSQRNFYHYFNTSVFRRTPQFSIGNSFTPQFYGPGTNDFDVAVNKNIPLGKVTFQLRAEAYNVFNHTQFNSVDNSAVFDPSGNQTNTDFGRINGSGDPRIMQLAGRISF